MKKWNQAGPIAHALLVALFVLVSISALLPLVFVAIISLSSTKSIAVKGYSFFPMEWSLDAYRYMWTRLEYIGHSFLVSCLITLVGTALSLGLISTMAFALSRREFRLRKLYTAIVVIPMFFGGGLAAGYVVNTQLFHLKDTLWALILPGACSSWYYAMLYLGSNHQELFPLQYVLYHLQKNVEFMASNRHIIVPCSWSDR